ncbi:MAG: acylphosphatase [Balneolaceae bacterium]
MDTAGKHLMISGRVQGVGFRNFTQQKARKLGLQGWVRNLNDGRVEVVVRGAASDVYRLIETLKQGPAMARVDHLEELDREEDGPEAGFEIRG